MIDMAQYGFPGDCGGMDGAVPGRITSAHRGSWKVICPHGEVSAQVKAGVYYGKDEEYFPVVGDYVLLQYNGLGDSLILKTLERKSKFSRSDFLGHPAAYVKTVMEQVLAANFDYVFIAASMNRDFNVRRLERYLAAAWQSGGIPVVVLTKADLAGDIDGWIRRVEAVTLAGTGLFAVSAKTGYGMDALRDFLRPGRTIALLGSSGVGKSSLVNALEGREVMKVSEIREDDARGRHTTTHRQLFVLDSGAMIIDTPGMRELGMFEAEEGLSEAFADVEEILPGCKFSDCSHKNEPGCAVNKALEDGSLSPERWKSYLRLRREDEFVARKKNAVLKSRQRGREATKPAKRKTIL